jgi:hypothetical protein
VDERCPADPDTTAPYYSCELLTKIAHGGKLLVSGLEKWILMTSEQTIHAANELLRCWREYYGGWSMSVGIGQWALKMERRMVEIGDLPEGMESGGYCASIGK